jgi:hypothetical protein
MITSASFAIFVSPSSGIETRRAKRGQRKLRTDGFPARLKSFNEPRRDVPNRDHATQVQQASNTGTESIVVRLADLDKIAESQHADCAPTINWQGQRGRQ